MPLLDRRRGVVPVTPGRAGRFRRPAVIGPRVGVVAEAPVVPGAHRAGSRPGQAALRARRRVARWLPVELRPDLLPGAPVRVRLGPGGRLARPPVLIRLRPAALRVVVRPLGGAPVRALPAAGLRGAVHRSAVAALGREPLALLGREPLVLGGEPVGALGGVPLVVVGGPAFAGEPVTLLGRRALALVTGAVPLVAGPAGALGRSLLVAVGRPVVRGRPARRQVLVRLGEPAGF
ncbi:hypothetical protein [Micromonospora echinaurantiaca]|uniref:hypothetical protein n=1 Tax=Micromonospora echinaurantiaca TaxID=47857 RepID=UPI003417C171